MIKEKKSIKTNDEYKQNNRILDQKLKYNDLFLKKVGLTSYPVNPFRR